MVSIRTFPGVDKIKSIVRSPIQMDTSGDKTKVVRTEAIGGSWKASSLHKSSDASCSSYYYWHGNMEFENIYCDEHKQWELVMNYVLEELHIWYAAGLHPRFPVFKILVDDFKQNLWEARRAVFDGIFRTPGWRAGGEERAQKKALHAVLKDAKTPERFKKLIEPFTFVNFYGAGRRHRVRHWWKTKFKERSFTVDDFFAVQNQELRRYMLRRGVEIKDVLARMTKLKEDAEGALYLIGEPSAWDRRTYLHVKCPSTAQDYLLEVPNDTETPAAGRRWTFDVPADAEFLKEA